MQFGIDEAGVAKIREWEKTLPDEMFGCIGGRISYTFTPTTLGVITVVKDAVSGSETNITDFENW